MNFRTFLISLILLIVLGITVSSANLVFDRSPVYFSFDIFNGSQGWYENGTYIAPVNDPIQLRVPQLASCNTIDTNAFGYFTCGSDEGETDTDTKWALDPTWLFNQSGLLTWNETRGNLTLQYALFLYNNTFKTYVQAINTSVVTYINNSNNSMKVYVDNVNLSMKEYVD